MRNLPPAARHYMITLWGLTLILGIATYPDLAPALAQPWLTLAAVAAFVLAGRTAVMVELQPGHRMSLTVYEAFCMLFIPTIGLGGGWAFAAGTILMGFWERRPWERTFFNSASFFLSYSCAFAAYTLLQPAGQVPFGGPLGVVAFLGVALAYYLSNTLLVTTMIALATRRPLLRVYRAHIREVSWVQLLIFMIGASMAALWAVNGWLVLYGLCTLLIAHRAFATIVELHGETRRRQELAEERARLAEELQQRQAELDRSERLAALGTFSAGIAHEFNNVLTAVSGHAQMGQLLDEPGAKDEALAMIGRVAMRATSITGSLLAFARQRAPELRLASLQIVIDDTLAMLAHTLRRDNVSLELAVEELPPLLCDPGQIGQVLLNLITNAHHALRDNGGGTIRLSLTHDEREAVLVVSDDGPGIAPEVLEKLFQPFVTTKAKGTGLGMAICFGIVQSHHGTIGIASTPGAGTTVTVRLPLPEAAPPSDRHHRDAEMARPDSEREAQAATAHR